VAAFAIVTVDGSSTGIATVDYGTKQKWFLDVSNGFEDVRQGSCDQVNDCDEGCGFAVSAGA